MNTAHQKRKILCSLYHAASTGVPEGAAGSASISRWATERKMTGNDVAYFSALYNWRRLLFNGELYSIRHCLKRTAYGRLQFVRRQGEI